MAPINFYMVGGTLLNGMQPTQQDGTAPTDVAFATATGWQVGATAAGNYAGFRANTEVARTVFSTTVQPNTEGLVTGATGNAFRTLNPLSGVFASGNWTVSASLRSTVAMLAGQTNRLRWRVYSAGNSNGASATEITTSYTYTPSGGGQTSGSVMISNTVAGTANTTTNMVFSLTWAAPYLHLKDQYLFFVSAMEVVATSGTGNTRNADFRQNSSSVVTTADFQEEPEIYIPRQPLAFY